MNRVAASEPSASASVDAATLEVVVATMVYAPGESSGWHVHPVAHTVEVLSGSVTVYDASCEPHVYRAGETYVGGKAAHLARNDGDVPAEMIVSTEQPRVAVDSVTHLPAPPGCSVS